MRLGRPDLAANYYSPHLSFLPECGASKLGNGFWNHRMADGSKPKRERNVIGDWLVYFIVRILLCIVQALPDSACVSLANGFAWVFGDVLRIRAQLVEENLRHAFPRTSARRRRQIRRAMWQHLFLLACEIGRAGRKIHETNWRQHVTFEGCRELVAHELSDRPVILAMAHFGNFEVAGYVAGLLGMPTIAIARPLDNPYLQNFMVRFRQSTGQQIIPSRGTAQIVGRAVEAGASLAVLSDQYGGPKGCWVEFFRRPASCHKSIGLLVLSYQAPLMVINTHRTGRLLRFKIVAHQDVLEPRDRTSAKSVTEVTQWFTNRIEQAVSERPEQYWWLHRRWKDTREQLRRKRRKRRSDRTVRIEGPARGTGPIQTTQPDSSRTQDESPTSIHT